MNPKERAAALPSGCTAHSEPRTDCIGCMSLTPPQVVGSGCECWVTDERHWLSAASCGYGSGYEPGSQVEFNPDCPMHGRRRCWCGSKRGPRVPADDDGLGCLADIRHTAAPVPSDATVDALSDCLDCYGGEHVCVQCPAAPEEELDD